MTKKEEPKERSTRQPGITNAKNAHYVNNEKFLEELIIHKEKVQNAKLNGLEKPIVSNYLGECFLKIATHLSYKANFINYTYRDDMISDGIENCLIAAEKFDPLKSSNPFAYYTQIIYFAFVRRIQKEKKQQDTKYKMIQNMDLEQFISQSEGNEDYVSYIIDMMKKQMDTFNTDKK